MPEDLLFEYAIIRVVPRVEREEFLNVGVVLYCAKRKFLKAVYELNQERLKVFADIDITEIDCYLNAFERICNGNAESSAIAQLPVAERFRWLSATRSTILQTSKVHPGLCKDPEEMLQRIFRQLVQ